VRWLGAVAAVALGVILAIPAFGYTDRSPRSGSGNEPYSPELIEFFAALPDDDERRISFSPLMIGFTSGDRLERPLDLIPVNEPCDPVRARARTGYVVVRPASLEILGGRALAPVCFRDEEPLLDGPNFKVFGPR
jgi:hypothetical protein